MSLKMLSDALKGYDAQWVCPIMRICSETISTLMGGASEHQILEIAERLSQVSGGAGLEIVGLLMWPDGEEIPPSIEGQSAKLRNCLNSYEPGKTYPVYVKDA